MVAFVSGNGTGLFNTSLGVLDTPAGAGSAGVGRSGEQAYVNVASGNLVVQRQDELLVGQGPDVALVRTYNSQGQLSDDNGDNWRLGIHKRLYGLTGTVNTAGSTIRRTDGDGSELVYVYDAARGAYVNKDGAGSFDVLRYDSAAAIWSWTDGNSRLTESYSWSAGAGKLLSLADLDGNTVTYGYSGNLLTLVTDASGEKTYLDYTGNNLTAIRTVSAGGNTLTRVRYGYDGSSRLASVMVDLSPEDNSVADGKVYTTSYTYDGTSKRIASISQTDGSKVEFVYQTLQNSIRISEVRQTVDGGTRVTKLAYDLANRKTTVTDPLNNNTIYSYDSQGRLINLAGPAIASVSQNISYSYDAHGNVASQTDARGNVITYQYDGNGNLTLQRDAVGNSIGRTYGGRNELLTETVYFDGVAEGSTFEPVAAAQAPQTTRHLYDDKNRLRFTISPEGRVRETRYNSFGQAVASVQYTNAVYDTALFDTAATNTANALWHQDFSVDASGLTALPAAAFALQQGRLTVTTQDVATKMYPVVRGTREQPPGTVFRMEVTTGPTSAGRYLLAGAANLGAAANNTLRRHAAFFSGAGVFASYYDNGFKSFQLSAIKDDTSYVVEVVTEPSGSTLYVYEKGKERASGYSHWQAANDWGSAKLHLETFGGPGQAIAVMQVDNLRESRGVTLTDLANWAGGLDQTRTVRTDTGYDFRGQVSSVTRYGKVDATGAGVVDSTRSIIQYVYDQAGRLLQGIAPNGVATATVANDFVTGYAYDGLGRLLATTDTLGRVTANVDDDAGRKTTVTQTNGLAITSAYNRAGELISVVQADGAKALGETRYWYDANGRLRTTQDPTGVRRYSLYDEAGRKIADIDGTGSVIEYRYNAANQLARTIRYGNAVSADNVASLVDAGGNPAMVSLASIRPAASGGDSSSWNFYDAAGRLVKSVDQLGYQTYTAYDAASRVVHLNRYDVPVNVSGITDATGASDDVLDIFTHNNTHRHTRRLYDKDGNLQAILDAKGYLSEYRYDGAGRLIHAIAWASPAGYTPFAAQFGDITLADLRPAAHANDIHAWTLYDGQGRVAGRIDGEGYLTESFYDANGNRTKETRYAGKAKVSPTDISANTVIGDLRPAASGQDHSTNWTYTALNQVATQTDPEGTVTRYTYDSVGNLIKTDKAYGTTELRTLQTRYDKQGRIIGELTAEGGAALAAIAAPTQEQIDAIWAQYGVTHGYNAVGWRISSTDQNGHKTLFYYDADGQLAYSINALGEVTQNIYNPLQQMAHTIRYSTRIAAGTLATLTGGLVNNTVRNAVIAIANTALDSKTSYGYNLRGELTSTTDALLNVSTVTYNGFGDVVSTTSKIDADNSVTTQYVIDRAGRRTQTIEDNAGLKRITRTAYDAFGRVVQRIDGNNRTTVQKYDRLGRVVQITDPLTISRTTGYDAFDRVLTQKDGNGNTTITSYDKTNRSVTITTPEGIAVTTSYNRHGEVVKVKYGNGNTTSYAYDKNGNLKSTSNDALGIVAKKDYDKANRLTDTYEGNRTTYTYDAVNRILARTVDPAGLNVKTSYTYDAKGQVLTVTDPENVVTETEYDNKGQVKSVTVDPAGLKLKTGYAYDARGKTLTVTEGDGSANPRVTQYHYDKLGQRIKEVVNPGGLNITTRYAYDKNGNLVTKTDANGHVTRYAYDAENRLVYSVDPTGAVVKNDYDGNDNMIAVTAYATPINLSGLATAPTAAAIAALLQPNSADQVTRTVYDKDNRAVFNIDALNQVTKNSYDGNGNVLQVVQYATPITLPAAINLASVNTAVSAIAGTADRITRYVFDAANRQVYCIDALGFVTQKVYDNIGNIVKTVAYARVMDISGNPAVSAMQTTVAANVDIANDRINRRLFDKASRTIYAIDPEGYVQHSSHDNVGRLEKTTRYAGAITVADGATVASVAASLPATVPATAVVERQVYDNAGRLVDTIDGNNVTTRRWYDPAGRITSIFAAFGTSLESRTQHVFDAAGRLIAETRAYGTADAIKTTYAYDANGNRTKEIDPRGAELAEQDTDWALAQRKALGYVNDDNSVKLAASLTINERGALRALYTTSSVFDAAGRKTKAIDALGGITTTTYDAFGSAVKVTDPRGNSGHFYFDKLNRIVLQVDPAGYVTKTEYGASAKPERITQYASRAVGSWSPATAPVVLTAAPVGTAPAAYLLQNNARDQVTRLEYDKVDRVIKSIDAEGHYEQYTYDGLGSRATFRNKVGGVFIYQYDLRGKLISETLPITSADAGGTQVAVVNQYQYDAMGNRIKTIEATGLPEQRVTTYEFDALGRQRKKIGQAITVFKPGTGLAVVAPVEEQRYDVRGNKTETIDANGSRTVTYFDAANRKIAEVNAVGTLTRWTLDAAGNAIAVRIYGDAVTLPAGAALPSPVNASNYRETLYKFDANNAQIESRIKNVPLGRYDRTTGQYLLYQGDIVTRHEYDANGNIVKSEDGNGNGTHAYYNQLGQKALQIDAEGYAIWYSYDFNGSVTQEKRYANKLDPLAFQNLSTATLGSLLYKLQANVSVSDRITEYAYDRNNRLTEQRTLNVDYAVVDAASGALTEDWDAAVTRFVYDGLGKLIRKIDAIGNASDLAYDLVGRQIQEQGAAFTDFEGVSVRPTKTWVYDGLGNVKAETRHGKVTTDNQVEHYEYDVAGRMDRKIDATGALFHYYYDAAGNTTRTDVYRHDADGNGLGADITTYGYDGLNREISRQVPADAGTDTYQTRYSAFGDIVAKGVNGGWHEFADYNAQGKVWRTNSEQGVTKTYVYDANGNATLSIESTGTDLRTMTLDQMLAHNDAHRTYTTYDRRNLVVETVQSKIASSRESANVRAVTTQVAQGDFTGGLVTVGPVQQVVTRATTDTFGSGSVAITSGSVWQHAYYETKTSFFASYQVGTINLHLPDLSAWGSEETTVVVGVVRDVFPGHGSYSSSGTYPSTQTTITLPPIQLSGGGFFEPFPNTLSISIYKKVVGTNVLIASFNRHVSSVDEMYSHSSYVPIPKTVQFKGQSPSTDRLVVWYRPAGTSGPYQSMVVPKYLGVDGWFAFDWSGWAYGNYDIRYIALDKYGNLLNHQSGQMALNGSTASISQTSQKIPGAGFAFFGAGGTLHLAGQGGTAQSLTLRYRSVNSDDAWTTVTLDPSTIAGKAALGWFSWNYGSLTGDYEYVFEAKDANARVLNKVVGKLSLNGTPQILSYTPYEDLPALVKFSGQPASATALRLQYRPLNSSSAYTSILLSDDGSNPGSGTFYWDASALVLDPLANYDYEFQYEVFDGSSQLINKAHGSLRLGAAPATFSHVNDARPANVTELKWVVAGLSSSEATIRRRQELNAFGEVAGEIDGLNRRTDLVYNTLGRLVRKLDPLTDITLENGFVQKARPETVYYYDLLGQVVGTSDANGNIQTRRMINSIGTGWIAQQYHADKWQKKYGYDMLGNQRVIVDENNGITRQTFDTNNRLVRIERPQRTDGTKPRDDYQYDAAGNRIAHTNGLGFRERFYYDAQNRIVKAVSFEGRVTRYSYAYDATITSLPGSVAGGWVKTTTDPNNRTKIDKTDTFERLVWRKDLGDHTFSYSYDAAGWLRQQTGSTGQHLAYDYYDNGYVKSISDHANNSLTEYGYDAEGNRTFEGYSSLIGSSGNREYYENSEIAYDELNRVKRIHDPKYDINYEYDAVGNRRRIHSVYHDGVGGNKQVQDYWYKYDSMNRFVVTMGSLSGGRATGATDASVTVSRGSTGVALEYDGTGQRRKAVYANHTEEYSYSADGYLEDTRINAQLRARRINDALGRAVTYYEYNTSDRTVTSRTSTYDKDNKLTKDHDNLTGKGTDYRLLADGTLNYTETYGDATKIQTHYGYEWWDSAKESTITATPYNPEAPAWKSGYSKFVYDTNGNVKEVRDEAGKRYLRYTTNGEGLILRRSEIVNNTINKVHNYYYLNGHRVGDVGNDGVSKEDYAQALARDKNIDRKEANKRFRPAAVADFDQNYLPIGPGYPGTAATSYVVRAGDTLQAIASQLWGDASMWYLIADANGLTGQEPLPEGMSLTVPNKVTNIHNNSSTFQVYNPGEAIGDTMPTLPDAPPPPANKGGGGCGGIAKILVIVIAIVATVLTAGAAAVAMGLVQGATLATATVGGMMSAGLGALGGSLGLAGAAAAAIGGAVGSILSQGAAMAMGVQDKFSWSGVAMSAVGAGVGAGLGNPAGASTLATVGRAAASNAITQGVAVATGLQKKFDWRGVAASALGAGVGHGVGKALKDTNWLVKGTAEGMANGGVQAAVTGQQPNWGAITAGSFASTMGNGIAESLADGTFGNALGNSIAESIGRGSQQTETLGKTFAEDMAARKAANPLLNWQSGDNDGWSSSGDSGGGVYGAGAAGAATNDPYNGDNRALLNAAEREMNPGYYTSVAGQGRVAAAGDSISRMLGTSDPQAVGNFMRANGLSDSTIYAGRNYFIPDSPNAYGDSATLGLRTLSADNGHVAVKTTIARGTADTWTARDYDGLAKQLTSNANLLNKASEWAYSQGNKAAGTAYRQEALNNAQAASIYSSSALRINADSQRSVSYSPTSNPFASGWNTGDYSAGLPNSDYRNRPNLVVQGGFHVPISPGVAVGPNASWSSQSEKYSIAPDVQVGSLGDVGISAGIYGDNMYSGPAQINFGFGKYMGLQFQPSNSLAWADKSWYHVGRYVNGISIGVGAGFAAPANVTFDPTYETPSRGK